jgi:hypothetical protein
VTAPGRKNWLGNAQLIQAIHPDDQGLWLVAEQGLRLLAQRGELLDDRGMPLGGGQTEHPAYLGTQRGERAVQIERFRVIGVKDVSDAVRQTAQHVGRKGGLAEARPGEQQQGVALAGPYPLLDALDEPAPADKAGRGIVGQRHFLG